MGPQPLTEEAKREIGQHFVFGFHGFEASEEIKTLIRDYYVGNVILMKRNIQSAGQTRALVRELQAVAQAAGHKKPLLVGIDQENGLVAAFSSPNSGATLPGAMALAATGSPELAQEVYNASATELKLAGINWVYSPVADVNTDSRNPVIGVRSFGDDPEKVALFATAASRGAVAAGVAPSAKHFPGHGDTHVDSHLALPRILKTRAQIDREELVPFAALVSARVPCVMTGHMALPLVVGDDTPCSLARAVTTGILREDMGFEGVIVTDCLEMDAIAAGVGVEKGAVRALEAGADVVMVCHTYARHVGSIEAAYSAVVTGRLDLQALRESGQRVAIMKDRFAVGSVPDANDNAEAIQEANARAWKLSKEVYPRSTTVVWNAGAVPLARGSGAVLLVTPQMEAVNPAVDDGPVRNTAGPSYLALAAAVRARAPDVHHVVLKEGDVIPDGVVSAARAVLWVMRNADLKQWQLEALRRVQGRMRELGVPVVLVASCGPYDLAGQKDEYEGWTAYIATYEFTPQALESLVEVVFGEKAGTGRVPVAVA